MIILVEYSMMLLACAGAAETISSHGPHGKNFNSLLARKECAIYKSPVKLTHSLGSVTKALIICNVRQR